MAAKQTSSLIPMCHPLQIAKCSIDFRLDEINSRVEATCTVKVNGQTGVEMEALTGANIALLTIYDMCKAVDKNMTIQNVHVIEKEGGKSGHYKKNEKEVPVVFAVSGYKNTGKTTLIEKIIPLLKEEGYTVGTIKHDGHVFELDTQGTDTDRHKKAGAKSVTIYGASQTIYRGEEHTLAEMIQMHKGVDVLIVEGLKNSDLPKIEMLQGETHQCKKETLLAIVAEQEYTLENIPVFSPNQIPQLVEHLKSFILTGLVRKSVVNPPQRPDDSLPLC
jgi:molybdopterin-guanine dinucleotide biosynthesis protein MobB